MADYQEKQVGGDITEHNSHPESIHKAEVTHTKIAVGDDAYMQAYIKEPPKPWAGVSIMLYLFAVVGFFCSTSNGFDSSMFGALLSNVAFKSFFDVQSVGIGAGIVSSMNQIGGVVAIPFIGPALDTFGRRMGMFFGATIIIIGVVIQGTVIHTNSTGQFMGGRFLMGMGVSLVASAGPCYVIETMHPSYRGIVTGLYNIFWPVGAIVATGTNLGSENLPGNQSWIIPIWMQMLFPALIFVFVWLLPESPRWQYTNGNQEEAKAFLTKYHGHGNPESEWVKLQMWEYESHLEQDGADKRWWDYRALFKNRASRYRLTVNCLTSLFGQWAGNGVVSYFLSGVLDTAGISDPHTKNKLFVAMNAVQIIFSGLGCLLVDTAGRRKMLIWVNIGCGLCWVGVVAGSGVQAHTGSKASSSATVAMIYIFQSVYSVGWTPLQALYPVEVLSQEMRAKGMAFSTLFVNCGTLVNQFGFPVALQKIEWKTYFVFMVWCFVQAGIIYLLMPETKNRTLEELDDIFNAKSPVKASTEKKKLGLDSQNNVVSAETEGNDMF